MSQRQLLRRCEKCGAMMRWAINHDTNRWAALDAQPWKTLGDVMMHGDGRYFQILSPELVSVARERSFPLYTNHRDTCPAREETRYEKTFGSQEKELYEYEHAT